MGVENIVKAATMAGQRQAKRARVLLAGKLQTASGEVDARLRDISSKGALVECCDVPPVGSEVVFSRGQTVVPARVAWTLAGRVGLEFHYPIDENEVLVQLKKAPAAQGPRFRRPGLNEGLSGDDLKVARAWGVTVGIALPDGF
ncbi:MAG TPA: PilZ domain-containing protein [Allosphingosinicella sp.]|nr:PilZ domain-containing protein [Allosphingosinicella sp.]